MSEVVKIGRLMMIDDDEVDHKLCRRLITRSGLVKEFLPFLSAEEALDYLRTPGTPPVDVVLLDINMPRMNGFEFLDAAIEHLGPRFAHVVVMLTTSLDPRDRERALGHAAVSEFCNKPLVIEHLEQVSAMLQEMQQTYCGSLPF